MDECQKIENTKTDEELKKYCAEDVEKINEAVERSCNIIDEHHFNMLKDQTKAFSREEKVAVASVIEADILLEALGTELLRLADFESRIRNVTC